MVGEAVGIIIDGDIVGAIVGAMVGAIDESMLPPGRIRTALSKDDAIVANNAMLMSLFIFALKVGGSSLKIGVRGRGSVYK
eukprot:CAMPEP_0171461476 /NCGR_PEP_ID=MMETSP0945-20130129/5908_1 /TAXON_ID=109269 /ORGANISM="Vaucheria litorea, Strain CCMP2940" /LENGTH=80 /DNA_ID=CAMNT_0011987829 /DNA_START=1109 /DNA_END=1351 /DNA_ORIENTATION=+